MSVIPRSLFATDESPLIPNDKSCIMHAVENQDTIEVDSVDIFAVDDTEAAEKKALPFLNKEFNEKVIILNL